MKYLVVGAGLFGSVFAHEAAKQGHQVTVLEKRDHVGGNIYTKEIEGIQVHMYGAHIFHTKMKNIWDYVQQFAEFNHYVNSPIANYHGEIYNLPFNMNTFNKLWGVITPDEAKAKIDEQKSSIDLPDRPQNLEEQAISLIGPDVYQKLVKGYTEKQWGRDCKDLPAFIIKRLPLRFIYDNNYFNDRYQGIPIGGYTEIVEKMLEGSQVELGVDYFEFKKLHPDIAEKTIYTGMIDEYFDFKLGHLEYRTVRFETEVLDTDITIKDGNLDGDTKEKGTVEFKNVSFAYPDAAANVVENISFKANKGETIAFIGATGCGKSTVINLIPRFYDVTDGEVLVDGINVKDYKQNELRNKIGYVSQKAILFSGDVESNVAYGDNGKKDATPDEVKEAVKIACADDFVENLKDKYHGYVAQGGDNFSGGQKQRLSIARAIAKKAEILIFDDSFSALDYKTDRKLRTALKKQCSDTTKIIVAQRIGTIRDADLIIVLDGGKIAGKGTHSELMESCEEYRQIAYSQLSKEELA